MGLLVDFIRNSAGLVAIICLINMETERFREDKEHYNAGRDFWIDLEIQRTTVSSSIGLSFLFFFLRSIGSSKASPLSSPAASLSA